VETFKTYQLGAVHKRRLQGGKGDYPLWTFYGKGDSSDADVRSFLFQIWSKKQQIF